MIHRQLHAAVFLFAIVPLLPGSSLSAQPVEDSAVFTAQAIRDIEIAAQDAGRVAELLIEEGARVEAGQPLVKLNRTLYELEADRAMAEMRIAELERSNTADLGFAQKSAEYNRVLLRRLDAATDTFPRAVTQTEREQADLELQKSEFSIQQAELQLALAAEKYEAKKKDREIAERRLSLRTISSPISGIVVETRVDDGEWAEAGEVIARVVNYDRLKIRGYVPAEKYSVSDVGKTIFFQVVQPRLEGNPRLEATITFVSPEIEPRFFSDPKVRLVAEIDNPDRQIRINTEMRLVD